MTPRMGQHLKATELQETEGFQMVTPRMWGQHLKENRACRTAQGVEIHCYYSLHPGNYSLRFSGAPHTVTQSPPLWLDHLVLTVMTANSPSKS